MLAIRFNINNMQSFRIVSKQFAKYIAVGALSNGFAYGLYIIFTLLGINPVIAMTLVYGLAGFIAFAVNRGWTFRSHASLSGSALRYLISLSIGYGTSFTILSLLYLQLGLPHQAAQLIAMVIVGIELFLLSRYYVFP